MEQRRKSSPERQSVSVASWRKKGGGPCALVTPPPVDDDESAVSASFLAAVTTDGAIMPSRIGSILIIDDDA